MQKEYHTSPEGDADNQQYPANKDVGSRSRNWSRIDERKVQKEYHASPEGGADNQQYPANKDVGCRSRNWSRINDPHPRTGWH